MLNFLYGILLILLLLLIGIIFIILLLRLLLLLFSFISETNSIFITSLIISRNLFDNILSIPSLEISNISAIVFSILCINCCEIILLFFKKNLSKISL